MNYGKWQQGFVNEFGIHFKTSPDELVWMLQNIRRNMQNEFIKGWLFGTLFTAAATIIAGNLL